jgi:alpha-L-rhamnosidase
VADWIYRYAAGIDTTPLDAGFHTVILHPVFDARLGSVQFDYDSAYGPIHSDWVVKGTAAEWHVTIPPNTTGKLQVTLGEAGRYKLDGKPLANLMSLKGTNLHGGGFELAPGSYTFVVQL